MRRTEAVFAGVLALLAVLPAGGCRSNGVEVEGPPRSFTFPMIGSRNGGDGYGETSRSEFASARPNAPTDRSEKVVQVAHAKPITQNEPILPPPSVEQIPAPKESSPSTKDSPQPKEPPPPTKRPNNGESQQPGPTPANPPVNSPGNLPANAPGIALNRPPMPLPLPPAVASDPHKRIEPTTSGSILNLPPGKSPIEKALELAGRLDAVCADNVAIKDRVRMLEDAIQARDRLLNSATRDMQEATTQISKVRQDLAAWAEELKQQQARLRQQDTEHQELLRTMIQMLEKELGPRPIPKPMNQP